MEVILQEDVLNLGQMGAIVRVRDGYARNFLLPRGLALVANRRNVSVLEHQQRIVAAKLARQQKHGEAIVQRLSAVTVTIRARAGEEGRLFGSVTNMDIERSLREQGFDIERRRILLEEPIKTLGASSVAIQVASGLQATITVTVEPEVSQKAEE
jgi:large subunit ribosomal protein L9